MLPWVDGIHTPQKKAPTLICFPTTLLESHGRKKQTAQTEHSKSISLMRLEKLMEVLLLPTLGARQALGELTPSQLHPVEIGIQQTDLLKTAQELFKSILDSKFTFSRWGHPLALETKHLLGLASFWGLLTSMSQLRQPECQAPFQDQAQTQSTQRVTTTLSYLLTKIRSH